MSLDPLVFCWVWCKNTMSIVAISHFHYALLNSFYFLRLMGRRRLTGLKCLSWSTERLSQFCGSLKCLLSEMSSDSKVFHMALTKALKTTMTWWLWPYTDIVQLTASNIHLQTIKIFTNSKSSHCKASERCFFNFNN